MRLSTAPELPALQRRDIISNQVVTNSYPFEHVLKNLDLNSAKERAEKRKIRKSSQEVFIPPGIKSYDDAGLQEMTVRSRFKSNDYKQRYMSIYQKNPYAFHKQTGEFTLYSDFSVRIYRQGPYNKRNK
jgi:hypothetical protein